MSLLDRWRNDRHDPEELSPAGANGTAAMDDGVFPASPEAWYRRIVELSPDGIVVSQDGRVVYANRAALRIGGIPEDEDITGVSVIDLLPIEERERLLRTVGNEPTDGSAAVRVSVQRRDGMSIPVEVTSAPVLYKGRPAVQSMLRDISAFVEQERRLVTQSRTAEVLASLNGRLLTIESRDELFMVAGEAMRDLFASTANVLLGHTTAGSYAHFYSNGVSDEVIEVLSEVAARELPALESETYVARRLDAAGLTFLQRETLEAAGIHSFMMSPVRMVSAEFGAAAITFDQPDHPSLENVEGFRLVLNTTYVAAQRIGALEDIRLNEERFRDAAEANPAGFAILAPIHDAEGVMIDAEYVFKNSAKREILERLCGDPEVKLFSHAYTDPASFTAGLERFRTALRRGEPLESIGREDFPGGPERWVRRRVLPTAQGNLSITVRDITAEVLAQRAVEEAEERFKAAAESNPGAFLILQPVFGIDGAVADYSVVYANHDAVEKLLPNAPDEDARLLDLVGRDAVEETRAACDAVLISGQPADHDVRLARPGEIEGTWFRRRITTQNGRLFVTYDDITEDRQREAEAQRNVHLLRAAAEANRDSLLLLEPMRDEAGTIVDFRLIFRNQTAFERRVDPAEPDPRTLRAMVARAGDRVEQIVAEYIEAYSSSEPAVKQVSREVDGEVTWFERYLSSIGDVLMVIYRDVTGFRREIDDLGAAEADRRAVLEGLSDAIVVTDLDESGSYRVVFTNQAFREMVADPLGQEIGAVIRENFDETSRRALREIRVSAHEKRTTVVRELDAVVAGVPRTLSIAATPILDNGEIARVIWRATDLSAQREAARRLVAAAEANPDAFLIMDPVRNEAGTITDFSIAFENEGAREIRRAFSGLEQAAFLSDLVGTRSDSWETVLREYTRTLETEEPNERELTTTDPHGRIRHYYRRLLPLGDTIIVTYRETTDRVNELRVLEAAEREKQAILDGLSDLICVSEPDETGEFLITYANKAYLAFMGLTADKVIGKPRRDFQSPDLYEMYDEVRRVAIERKAPYSRELTGMVNGERRYANVLVTPFFNDDGACIRTIWRITDLTEQREAEAERDTVMAQQSAILDGLSDFVYLLERDENGEFRFTYGNHGVDRKSDVQAELIGKRIQDTRGLTDGGASRLALLQRCLETREPADGRFTSLLHGRELILDIRATPLVDPDGEVRRVIWRATDLTDRDTNGRRLEAVATANLDPFSILEPIHDSDGQVVDFAFRYSNAASQELNRAYSGLDAPQRLSEVFAPYPRGFEDELKRCTQIINSGQPYEHEMRTRDAHGNYRWLWRQIIPIEGGIVVTGRDVTEQHRQADELVRAGALLRETLDGLLDAISVSELQPDGRWKCVVANQSFAENIGRPLDEIVGRYIDEYIPEERRARNDALRAEAISTGHPVEFEFERPGVDGKMQIRLLRIIPVFNQAGECIRTIWRSTDITQIRATQRRFEAAADASLDSFMIYEPMWEDGKIVDFRLVFVNARARERLARWPSGIPQTMRGLVPEDPESFREALAGFVETLETRIASSGQIERIINGERRSFIRQVLPLDGAVAVSYRDITADLERRLELENAARHQRAILEGLSDAVVVSDRGADGNYTITYANPAFFKLLDISPDIVLERGAGQFLTPEIVSVVHEARLAAIEAKAPIDRTVKGSARGRHLDLEARITPVFDANGECARLICRLNDVSVLREERQQAESAERNLRTILENLTDGIIVTDRDGTGEFRISYIHPVPALVGRMDYDGMLGKTWSDLSPPTEAGERIAITERVLAEKASVDFDSTFTAGKGEVIHLAGRATPVLAEDGTCERIVWRYADVTEAYRHQRETTDAEANLRAILEGLTDSIAVTDRDPQGDFRISYVNPLRTLADVLAPERLIGRRYEDLGDILGAEQLQVRLKAQADAIASGLPVDFETYAETSDGQRVDEAGRVTPLFDEEGECYRLIWRYTDMTQNYRDQVRLREAERNYRGIIEAIADGLLVFDRDRHGDFRVTFSKPIPILVDQLGDLTGQRPEDLWEGERLAERLGYIEQAIGTRGPVDFETGVMGPGNRWVYELARVTPIFNDAGACTRLVWRFTDVTETYAAERNQRAILDGLSDHLYVFDRDANGDFRATYANEAAFEDRLTGLALGNRFDEFLPPEDAAPRMALLERVAASGQPASIELKDEQEYRHRWVSINASPVIDRDGACRRIIWRVTDSTPLREQQARIEANERFLDAILSALRDFIYVFDRDDNGEFRYSYINNAARRLNEQRDRFGDPIGLRVQDVMEPDEAAIRNQMFEEAIRTQSSVSGEVSRIMNDGSIGYASAVVTPVIEPDGSCNRLIFRATDTTTTRVQQLEIEENERNWRAILDALADVLIVMDREEAEDTFRVTYINAAREALTGRPDEQLLGKCFAEFLPEDGAERMEQSVEAAIEERRFVDFEGVTPDSDGEPLTYSARITPVYDRDGLCHRVILRYTDITASRRVEQRLEKSEEDRNAIVENLADIVLLLDRDEAGEYRLAFANPPFFATGRTAEETIGKRFSDFLAPAEASAREAMLQEAISTGAAVEQELTSNVQGTVFHYTTRVSPIFKDGVCVRTVWRYTDISELVAHRQKLEARELEQRAVLDGLSDAIVVVDLDDDGHWRIVRTNRAHEELTGREPGSLIGQAVDELATRLPNSADSYELLKEAVARGASVERERPAIYNGTEMIVSSRATPIFNSAGQIRRCIFRISDVTEARQREAEVNRLGRAMDGASDEIYIIDAGTFEVLQLNAGARDNLGYGEEAFSGLNVAGFVVEPSFEELMQILVPLFSGESSRLTIYGAHRRRDGSTYPIEARVQLIEHESTPVLVATVRDVSERRRLEESVARLAAIVESSADAVIGLNDDGSISHWNRAAEKLFAVPEADALGSTLATVFAGDPDAVVVLQGIASEGGSADAALRSRDGRRVDISASAFAVQTTEGRRLGAAIVARDIRWRVEATRALRESERRFRSIFDQAPEGILIQRATDGVILDINQRLLDMIEHPRDSVLGLRPIELGVVGSPEVVMSLDRELAEGVNSSPPRELALRTRTGALLETLVTVQAIELNGERCFLSFLSDVTHLRQTERDLLRAEEGLRSITQNLPVILTSWDSDERCTLATGLGLAAAGLDGEVLVGHHMREIIGPSAQLEQAIETSVPGSTGSLEFSLGGRIFEAQYRVLPDGSSVAVAVDVTEMRTTLRQIDAIVENMPITFLAFDADGIITVSKGASGVAVDESSVGRSIIDIYAGRTAVVDDIRRVLSGERVSNRYARGDGRTHEVHYNPVRTVDGSLAGAAVVIIDVTDRLRAEQAVLESNERFRQMAETATDGIVSANRKGSIVFANEAMGAIFGYSVEELIGEPLTILMPHGLASSHRVGFNRYAESGEKRVSWRSLELTGRRKDGVEFTLELSMSEGILDGEPVVTAFIRDITERRRTEEALMQAQKLESLGVLAGGIAHDFNNMLVAIMGNAGLALAELQSESPAYETVQEIELAARRAAELARQMLAYSGKGRLSVNTIDLTALVEEIPHLLRTSIGKGVTLRYDLARDLPGVEADATQLRQVVMNLVINASDAIGDGEGVIAISTGAVDADREYLRSTYIPGELRPGRYCYLEVTDTGSGMSPETLAKIFDPFFTTKFTGKGLGLAAVLGIVRGHKGTIKVESTLGEGTTFRLLLPATGHETASLDVPGAAPSAWRGSGSVLVVDDEESVRHVTSRALKMMGFDVIDAVDGQDGWEQFQARHRSLACVLMDLTMPRMNGETAAKLMKEFDPSVPIVLMSGFDEGEMASRFRDAGMAAFVQKPFEIRTLREAMRLAVTGAV